MSRFSVTLVDSSYFSFYRFFATLSWYRRAFPRENGKTNQDWLNNPTFMEKYIAKFTGHIQSVARQFKCPSSELIFARDCPQEQVWRNELYPLYKMHRRNENPGIVEIGPGPVIKHSNKSILEPQVKVIRVPKAEGDDIIACIALHLSQTQPQTRINIIAVDSDFYQLLLRPNIALWKLGPNLSLVPIPVTQDPKTALMLKILSGDKSDGIPPIFPYCGLARAKQILALPEKLLELEKSNSMAGLQYKLNQQLIDFQHIPADLRSEIIQAFLSPQ